MTLYWFSLSRTQRYCWVHKQQQDLYSEAFDKFLLKYNIKRNPEWEKANGRMLSEIDQYRAINIGPPPVIPELSQSQDTAMTTAESVVESTPARIRAQQVARFQRKASQSPAISYLSDPESELVRKRIQSKIDSLEGTQTGSTSSSAHTKKHKLSEKEL